MSEEKQYKDQNQEGIEITPDKKEEMNEADLDQISGGANKSSQRQVYHWWKKVEVNLTNPADKTSQL